MQILLTGGHGFLGRHLQVALAHAGYHVWAPTRQQLDLRDRSAVQSYFKAHAFDACIHAAATGGGIGWMKEHPETAFLGNLLANTHVLEAAADHGVYLVGVSSACVYPRDAKQPMMESQIWEGEPEPSNGPYGQAKRMMLVQGAAAAAERGVDSAFVVPTNLYGPYDHFAPDKSHIVAALIRRFEEARQQGAAEVVCWGSGRATRDLLYAPDAAEGILYALQRRPGPAPINLGTGVEHSTATIAEAIAEATGYKGVIRWDDTRPDGMPRKVLHTGRAQNCLGWQAKTDLVTGLRETVEWFRRSG